MASVTPRQNFPATPGTVASVGYVTTSFDGPAGDLLIQGIAPNGAVQPQSVNVLIVCPSPGSQKIDR